MGRIAILAVVIALAAPARAGDAVQPGAGGTVRVGVPAGPDPVAGFDRELFAEAAREAGLGVAFEVVGPEAAPAALDAERIDVAAGPFSPGRAGGRRALGPVATGGAVLLKRRGDGSLGTPAQAAGKVLGLLGPASEAPRLRAEAAALRARVAAAPRAFADPLRDLAAGRVAALAGDLFDVAAAALARPDGVEVVGPAFGRPRPLVALARADRPGVADPPADRLDAALGRMRADGRLAAVQRRWFGLADPPDRAPDPALSKASPR